MFVIWFCLLLLIVELAGRIPVMAHWMDKLQQEVMR